jgi:hypothetical protein
MYIDLAQAFLFVSVTLLCSLVGSFIGIVIITLLERWHDL